MRFAIGLVAATVAISLSDWVFFGVIFHNRYMETPEVWRSTAESKQIAGSMVLAFLGTAAFFVLAQFAGVHSLQSALILALLAWAAASLPQTITTTLYVRYASDLAVSHALGWLARFLIAATAYALIVA